MEEIFNEDYYQNGIEKGVSLYSNYRWIPELSIPIAHRLTVNLGITTEDKVLDFGCALGFIVKSFRLLGINAWGYDISEYAINNVPSDTEEYVYRGITWRSKTWDWIICKDVLEHIPYEEIDETLQNLRGCGANIFVVVPLADGDKYNEPLYELDATHIIRENIEWWKDRFNGNRLPVRSAKYKMPGIKENWCTQNANGFFILKGI
jgi:SAM-dependent methyltransferase